jgi:hypothetical protein
MDYTIGIYKYLINAFQSELYKFIRFDEYISSSCDLSADNNVILRHDVDLLPHNALKMARLEHDHGINGTYYFRIVPESFNAGVIEKIAGLGHEVGYHYEDVDLVRGDRSKVIGDRLEVEVRGQRSEVGGQRSEVRGRRSEVRSQRSEVGNQKSEVGSQRSEGSGQRLMGDSAPLTNNHQPLTDLIDRAMESFVKNLETMRKIANIKTICMHGSPLSPYDNRMLWSKYDYRDYGVIGEPYFDLDFSNVAYYTDTGRRWDGDSVNVRDKVGSRKYEVCSGVIEVGGQKSEIRSKEPGTWNPEPVIWNLEPETVHFPRFRSTDDMIKAIKEGRFPEKAMLTIHPQRWHDRPVPWVRELVWQNVKNVGKYIIVKTGR